MFHWPIDLMFIFFSAFSFGATRIIGFCSCDHLWWLSVKLTPFLMVEKSMYFGFGWYDQMHHVLDRFEASVHLAELMLGSVYDVYGLRRDFVILLGHTRMGI